MVQLDSGHCMLNQNDNISREQTSSSYCRITSSCICSLIAMQKILFSFDFKFIGSARSVNAYAFLLRSVFMCCV